MIGCEERVRTRARALGAGVEAQMLSLGASAELSRAWRDWAYETVVEIALPEPPAPRAALEHEVPPSLRSSLRR